VSDSRLNIYINDHLALLVAELDLAKRCHGNNSRGELGDFLSQLLNDLQTEKALLGQMLDQLGSSENLAKQAMAWIAEKAGRFKLNDSILCYSQLSRLIELEMLYLGAVERHSFWENLLAARPSHSTLGEIDFSQRNQLAIDHADRLRHFRLEAATATL
jgi:hypothetical protein